MTKIQILGAGCPNCRQLAENAAAAAKALGIEYQLEKVTDVNDIVAFGVMMTPALAVDGVVKSTGKVLRAADVEGLLA